MITTAADSLLKNDSLQRAVEQMFLQGAHFGPAETVDSLLPLTPPATATDLFGAASTLSANHTSISAPLLLTENPLFQTLAFSIALVYVLFIIRYMSNIYTLFAHTINLKSGNRTFEMHNESSDSQFLNFMGLLGLIMMGTLCVKGLDVLHPIATLPYHAAAGVNLIATAALMIVFMAQVVVLYLIGATTLTQTFSHELIYIKRSMLALATILMTPMVLFYTFSPIGTGQIWIYIILSEGIIITILFLLRTL
ncbi:MAG: DUF4271 domain-containing protein, partial [Alistipes sp.]